MPVDTLSLARELKAANVPDGQAEAIAAVVGRSAVDSMSTAASKADLKEAELRLETRIEQSQNKLLVWFVATQVAVGALIVALVKL